MERSPSENNDLGWKYSSAGAAGGVSVVDAIFACMFYSFRNSPPNALSIEIEIATWDKNRSLSSAQYDQLLKNPPVTFFDGRGLPQLLDTDTFNTAAGQAAFAKALKTPNMFCGTPLHYLLYYSSNLFFNLLDKPIFQSPVVKQAVEDVLLMKKGALIRGNRVCRIDLWLKLIENGFFISAFNMTLAPAPTEPSPQARKKYKQ